MPNLLKREVSFSFLQHKWVKVLLGLIIFLYELIPLILVIPNLLLKTQPQAGLGGIIIVFVGMIIGSLIDLSLSTLSTFYISSLVKNKTDAFMKGLLALTLFFLPFLLLAINNGALDK